MHIYENHSIKKYNTFGIDASARYFSKFGSLSELEDLIAFTQKNNHPLLVIGGGSNILLTGDFDGLVIKNELTGLEKTGEDDQYIYVKAQAGENWHQFVLFCIKNNLAGVENLSLIPGNVGASPMQNIGAYGTEIKDVFHSLEAFHVHDKTIHNFSNSDCEFGYRDSVFKKKYKNQYIILNVVFRLNKVPSFNIEYGAIKDALQSNGIHPSSLTLEAVSQAVIQIRQSKLPDPAVIGNAGSFFKNPTISRDLFDQIKQQFPEVPGYLNSDGVKIAAGWLIESCGWKGYRKGDAGCHAKQALVLVNYGTAKGAEIVSLAKEIMQSVYEKFTINLEPEINII